MTLDPILKKLVQDVEAYANRVGVTPQSVLKYACSYGAPVWDRWLTGQSAPKTTSVHSIRQYMKKHPNGKA